MSNGVLILVRNLIPALIKTERELLAQEQASIPVLHREATGDRLSIAQAAKALRCSETHIRNLCDRGELGHFTEGRRRFIARDQLDEYRLRNKVDPLVPVASIHRHQRNGTAQ